MPQFRKLHTKIVDSFDVNDMPDHFHMLLWSWLPLIVCKEGRGIYDNSWIKSKLFPLRTDATPKKIEKAMKYFENKDLIYIYSVNNHEYFGIHSWHEYQNTARDAASPYPEPQEHVKQTHEQVASNSSLDKTKTRIDKDIDKIQIEDKEDVLAFPVLEIPDTPKEAMKHPMIILFKDVCNRFPGEKDWRVIIETMEYFLEKHKTEEATIQYLKPFWLDWSGRTRIKDGKPYDPASLVWLNDWAMNNDADDKQSTVVIDEISRGIY